MSEQRPEPLVPADVDLRDYAFMPLDVVRLRDSKIVDEVTGDEFRAAVLLWCSAWHQVPAGSLPDDDAQLAKFAGYGRVVKEWMKRRAGALHGFVLCSDGRLYHPVIAEKALEAWAGKRKASGKGKAGAIARWSKQDGTSNATAIEKNATAIKTDGTGIENACISDGNREGEDRDRDKTRAGAREASGSNGHSKDFEAFWSEYPKQVDRRSAENAFSRALSRADAPTIIAGAKLYAADRRGADSKFTRHPDNWLESDAWLEYGAKVQMLSPERDAETRDKADRLMRRGKYASAEA